MSSPHKSSPARVRRRRRRKKARNNQVLNEEDSDQQNCTTINETGTEVADVEVLHEDVLNAMEPSNLEELLSDTRIIGFLQPLLSLMKTDVERDMNDLIARVNALELNFTMIRNDINTLNSDAEITDENITRVARRITNVEHFLQNRGLPMLQL